MRHAGHSLAVALAAASLSACALVRSKYWHSYADEANPGVALVYGYIDMSQAPAPLQRLRATRVGGGPGAPDVYFATRGGLFYNEALPPGTYKLAALEGRAASFYLGPVAVFPGPPYAAALPARLGTFRVDGPGVYDVGSYKYERLSSFVDAFTVARATAPAEADLLRRLGQALVESKWERPVARRLAAVKTPAR